MTRPRKQAARILDAAIRDIPQPVREPVDWDALNRIPAYAAICRDRVTAYPTFNEQLASCAGREPIEFAQPIDAIVHPARGLTRMVSAARREMGEARWAELQGEWK